MIDVATVVLTASIGLLGLVTVWTMWEAYHMPPNDPRWAAYADALHDRDPPDP